MMTDKLSRALACEDYCPRCLGELDTGWECTQCGYDAIDDAMSVPPEAVARLRAMVEAAKTKAMTYLTHQERSGHET